jgi:two-component system, cell cycle sensor histidine kinase and response regulator CckA
MKSEVCPAGQTVLVVDDYEAVLSIVAEFLEAKGFVVLRATTSLEALDIAERYPGEIHILLAEAQMPDISGIALAEHLKLIRSAMAVIVMSGALDEATLTANSANLHAPLLCKPFTNGELLLKLDEVMGNQRDEPHDCQSPA